MRHKNIYLVFQVLYISLIKAQYTEVNKVCKASRPGQCYTLYNSTAGPLTWTQAQQTCISYNMTLATVPDVDTQTSLERLIETGSNTEAWTAGRVEDDNRWQRLNGEIYTETPKESSDINDNCGYLLVDTVTEFYSDSCTDIKYPLCSNSPKGSSCTDGDIHVGTVCLRVVSPPVNWYSAVIACNNLGYGLLRYESGLLQLNETYLTERNIWLDVYRHRWRWNTGIDISTIEYFNWDPHFGINIPDHCIYISDNGAKWKSQRCNSTTEDVRYFICEKDTTAPTSSPAATTVANSGVTDDKAKTSIPDYIIIASVIAGICFIIIVVVVMLLCRRKKTSGKSSTRSTPSQPPATSSSFNTSGYRSRSGTNHTQNEGSSTKKGYVYYNDAYEWTEDRKHVSNGLREQRRQAERNGADGDHVMRNPDVESMAASGNNLNWTDLCNMYSVGKTGDAERGRGGTPDQKSNDEKKQRQPRKKRKDFKTKRAKGKKVENERVVEKGDATAKSYKYGWQKPGSETTSNETHSAKNLAENEERLEALYAKVDKSMKKNKKRTDEATEHVPR